MARLDDCDHLADPLAGTIHGWPRRLARAGILAVLRPLIPLRLSGVESIPLAGPLLVVSNHLSNADPPLLSIAFPRPLFLMGKSELFRHPAFGSLLRRLGGFPVERGTADRAALRHALRLLDQGMAVCVFPEGGRSRTGALVPAFPGVGLLALQSRAPVLPVGITGSEYFPVNGEWPPRRPREAPRGVAIRFGEPFQVPEQVDGTRVKADEATRLMMTRVAALLPENYQGVYSSDARPPRSANR